MSFDHPALALLFWLLPLALAGRVLGFRARRRDLEAFAASPALARLLPRPRPGRESLRAGFQLAALALLIAAAMGPRWGRRYEEVEQKGRDLLVLLDCSRSMLAEDLAPNRLERAKADLRDLIASLPGHRVGLVGFAGRADLLCPLTTDYAFFNLALNEAGPDSLGRGGTLIGDAVRKALTLFGESGAETRDILLITDGEDQSSFPVEAAKAAAEQKVRIYAVGLGDEAEGGRIPGQDQEGRKVYATENGREHWSKLDASTLRAMALTTGGKYLNLGIKVGDLGSFYLQAVAGEAQRSFESRGQEHKIPRFQIFLGLGILLLLLDAGLALGPALKLLPLLLFILCGLASRDQAWASPNSLNEEGRKLYKKGDFAGAASRFEEAAKAGTPSPELAFNQGTALAAAGQADEAAEILQKALATPRKKLEKNAKYNLGYNAFQGRDYAKAASYFHDALALDPKDEEARRNLELALRLAAVSPPPPPQNKNSKDKKEDKDKKGQGQSQPQDQAGAKPSPGAGTPEPQAQPSPRPQDGKDMSREEAERLLDQMKSQEKDRRREKLKARAEAENVDKDW